MTEIVVTKPDECPFNSLDGKGVCQISLLCGCGTDHVALDGKEYGEEFPPDCPLFENDYLIKRRSENGTTKNASE